MIKSLFSLDHVRIMCVNTHVYMYASEMEVFEAESCVRGHHVFCSIWRPRIGSPRIGKQLTCKRELDNAQDVHAVAVMHEAAIVGHVPRTISAACSLFLQRKGTICCTISGSRHFPAVLPQGGLEVPCVLKFQGNPINIGEFKIWRSSYLSPNRQIKTVANISWYTVFSLT